MRDEASRRGGRSTTKGDLVALLDKNTEGVCSPAQASEHLRGARNSNAVPCPWRIASPLIPDTEQRKVVCSHSSEKRAHIILLMGVPGISRQIARIMV